MSKLLSNPFADLIEDGFYWGNPFVVGYVDLSSKWIPELHPRWPKGSGKKSGKFMPKGGLPDKFYTKSGQIGYTGAPNEALKDKPHNLAVGNKSGEPTMVHSAYISPNKLKDSAGNDSALLDAGSPISTGKWNPDTKTLDMKSMPSKDQLDQMAQAYPETEHFNVGSTDHSGVFNKAKNDTGSTSQGPDTETPAGFQVDPGTPKNFYTKPKGGQIGYPGPPNEAMLQKPHNVAVGNTPAGDPYMVHSKHISPNKLGATAKKGGLLDDLATVSTGKWDPDSGTLKLNEPLTPKQKQALDNAYPNPKINAPGEGDGAPASTPAKPKTPTKSGAQSSPISNDPVTPKGKVSLPSGQEATLDPLSGHVDIDMMGKPTMKEQDAAAIQNAFPDAKTFGFGAGSEKAPIGELPQVVQHDSSLPDYKVASVGDVGMVIEGQPPDMIKTQPGYFTVGKKPGGEPQLLNTQHEQDKNTFTQAAQGEGKLAPSYTPAYGKWQPTAKNLAMSDIPKKDYIATLKDAYPEAKTITFGGNTYPMNDPGKAMNDAPGPWPEGYKPGEVKSSAFESLTGVPPKPDLSDSSKELPVLDYVKPPPGGLDESKYGGHWNTLEGAETWADAYYDKPWAMLDPSETSALKAYKDGAYTPMNQMLRGTVSPHSYLVTSPQAQLETRQRIQKVDSAFQKMPPVPKPIVTFRGRIPTPIIEAMQEGKEDQVLGKTFVDDGYVSSSLSRGRAKDFGTSHSTNSVSVAQLTLPKGFKALNLEKAAKLDEAELLLPRGTQFIINKAYKDKAGTLWVEADAVMPEAG